ncbi:MAG TPA: bifunctional diaminohydroxyphosphoribosylaminopyrimidine deaminase/5-amino-6-(5-phosphoribosylamino)uracil reductase RibD [Gemmatimonadales bacterium]|jgi:diaminohydroxyphosphoribosylaminopyrimidine deaminase/5-amino-6-(5-phosphoribosylamino)uracil reductase
MTTDREAMELALRLAWRGWGRVGTNPMVGAIVLKNGEVVGEGWHAEFGGPHAEVAALQKAGEKARGGDLVVTLEPCRHHGKTPPCIAAILEHGIRRVVFAAEDVDPKARGGALHLRTAGVTVQTGLLADEVRRQNALFFYRHTPATRPFVALKLATSLDACIADGSGRSKWITGEESRAFVQWLRAGFDAIAVGLGTVRADNPSLTVRGDVAPLVTPKRVIFDREAATPLASDVVKSARQTPTLVVAEPGAPDARIAALAKAGVEVVVAEGPMAQLAELKTRGVGSILVEGGGILAGRFIEAGVIDRIFLLQAPILLGATGVPAFGALDGVSLETVKPWTVSGRRTLGADALTVLDRP